MRLNVPRNAAVLDVVRVFLVAVFLAEVDTGDVPAFNAAAGAAGQQAVRAGVRIACHCKARQLLFNLSDWDFDLTVNVGYSFIEVFHLVREVEHLERVDQRIVTEVIEVPDTDEAVARA